MNRQALQEALVADGINSGAYSLNGEPKDDALCLRFEQGSWHVFYSERGLRIGMQAFQSESDACFHVLAQLRADPTTRIGWDSGFEMRAGVGIVPKGQK